MLKCGWICSRCYRIMGVLSWGSLVPHIFSTHSGETICRTPKCFSGERTWWISSSIYYITFQGYDRYGEHDGYLSVCHVWWSSALGFLSVGLFVRHTCEVTLVIDKIWVHDFTLKALEYIKNFDTVGYGKVCSCAPTFNFLCTLPNVDTTKCRSPKMAKCGDFRQFNATN